jgi:hypothetical protein
MRLEGNVNKANSGTGPISGRLSAARGKWDKSPAMIDVDQDTLEEMLILVGIVVVVGMLLWKAFR